VDSWTKCVETLQRDYIETWFTRNAPYNIQLWREEKCGNFSNRLCIWNQNCFS
jgi:hypothetical protein